MRRVGRLPSEQRVMVLVGRVDALLRSSEGQRVLTAEHPQRRLS